MSAYAYGLDRFPDERTKLERDPTLTANAVQEIIRWLENGPLHVDPGVFKDLPTLKEGLGVEWNIGAWRGIGVISASGLGLTPAYAEFDAERVGKAQVGRLLPLVKRHDAPMRQVQRLERLRLACRHGRVHLGEGCRLLAFSSQASDNGAEVGFREQPSKDRRINRRFRATRLCGRHALFCHLRMRLGRGVFDVRRMLHLRREAIADADDAPTFFFQRGRNGATSAREPAAVHRERGARRPGVVGRAHDDVLARRGPVDQTHELHRLPLGPLTGILDDIRVFIQCSTDTFL